ncbi:DUF1931 family protein [Bradyrhizobium australafricanum]|uniref:DUF1931 family protein n=1 Tax=Bradyrhizobium australafricanum TaxID=2821406 RepID=UPI001CE2ED88|nr:DUF1931 family protein [Bradyrhizobium australafricanum]MCA6100669.1 DUF1931 family protein [Bradyrhizobium australafricanum]
MTKINFVSVREDRAKLTTVKGEAGLRTVSCGEETLPMIIAAVQSNQPRASHVMRMARFERFFRIIASVDVDKQDIKRYSKRYSDFINQKLYDFLPRAQAVAKANGGVILEPFDLPVTKGLQECIHEFVRLDEEIEPRLILDRVATRPPIDLAYGEDRGSPTGHRGTECRARAYVQHHRPRVVESIERALAEVFSYFRSAAVAARTAE